MVVQVCISTIKQIFTSCLIISRVGCHFWRCATCSFGVRIVFSQFLAMMNKRSRVIICMQRIVRISVKICVFDFFLSNFVFCMKWSALMFLRNKVYKTTDFICVPGTVGIPALCFYWLRLQIFLIWNVENSNSATKYDWIKGDSNSCEYQYLVQSWG